MAIIYGAEWTTPQCLYKQPFKMAAKTKAIMVAIPPDSLS
jgi:hypothetical protein